MAFVSDKNAHYVAVALADCSVVVRESIRERRKMASSNISGRRTCVSLNCVDEPYCFECTSNIMTPVRVDGKEVWVTLLTLWSPFPATCLCSSQAVDTRSGRSREIAVAQPPKGKVRGPFRFAPVPASRDEARLRPLRQPTNP